MERSDREWQKQLSPEQYRILRQKGTEQPGTGELLYEKREGVFQCAGCGAELFSSDAKFESGTGWPSFSAPISTTAVLEQDDESHGLRRIEVLCAACKGHLGHVFPDGPAPNGERYCLNSGALLFKKK